MDQEYELIEVYLKIKTYLIKIRNFKLINICLIFNKNVKTI